jgi:hypothetical protein
MNDLLIRAETPAIKADLKSTGWNLPANMTEADWRIAGAFLVQVDQARQWWLGDWWNACKWGEGKDACAEIGVNPEVAKHCGVVARNFEMVRRRTILTFSHHAEVCPIDDIEMQDKLLDWCLTDDKRKTVKELREKVQAYLAMKDWHETEKTRRFDVEGGLTVVANLEKDANLINWAKTEGLYVQIDRQTAWGNPFEIPGDGDRDTVCESYEVYFKLKKSLHGKLKSLKGKVLGCHCYPERCHGNYLISLANKKG